jgi:hypothetical protein
MDKRFQHTASAYGISGKFLWPIQGTIDVRPSVDLPPTGGFGRDVEENFNFHDLVTFRRAYTQVSGSPNEELVDGKKVPAQNNLSLTVVEDFNLLDVIDVKKMVSRITTRYYDGAKDVEIVLTGTRFEGFRIFGHEIIVKLATELFLHNSTFPKLQSSYKDDSAFRDQYHALSGSKEVPSGTCPDVHVTLVEEIIVPHPTKEFSVHHNVIDIPHIGKLFLAELSITPKSKTLNMIRWDLGCPNGGDGTVGGGQGGGVPPSS